MSDQVSKYRFVNEQEYLNLKASYRSQVQENQRLNAEVQRLNTLIQQLSEDAVAAREEAANYREMYLSLREGKYLLIPK
ncbi:hypothetical protein [Cohnella panacarvi]|uniref:hypothetical protein n=1 Tax=Cohnella panacarvi TaxID=400776 RepID=UPI00047DE9FD|nr:hypothetical protein [Cohnella panacarvi]